MFANFGDDKYYDVSTVSEHFKDKINSLRF